MIQALIERLKRETENGHNLMYLIDQENNRRQTPLFLAVAANDPGKVQLLIKEGGANVNTLAQVCQFQKSKCCSFQNWFDFDSVKDFKTVLLILKIA